MTGGGEDCGAVGGKIVRAVGVQDADDENRPQFVWLRGVINKLSGIIGAVIIRILGGAAAIIAGIDAGAEAAVLGQGVADDGSEGIARDVDGAVAGVEQIIVVGVTGGDGGGHGLGENLVGIARE